MNALFSGVPGVPAGSRSDVIASKGSVKHAGTPRQALERGVSSYDESTSVIAVRRLSSNLKALRRAGRCIPPAERPGAPRRDDTMIAPLYCRGLAG